MLIRKIVFLSICVIFNIGFYSNTKLIDPNFNKWKTTLLKTISEECNNIPKDRDSIIIKLDSSICSRITGILHNINFADREKLYKKLKNNHLPEFDFDKLVMIDLSISGETLTNDVLFLFVKGRKVKVSCVVKVMKKLLLIGMINTSFIVLQKINSK